MRVHNAAKAVTRWHYINIPCMHKWSNMFANHQNHVTGEFTEFSLFTDGRELKHETKPSFSNSD